MKRILLTLVLNLGLPNYLLAEGITGDVAHHPTPQKPTYLSESIYGKFKDSLPPVPTMSSSKQKDDESILLSLQKSRTDKECDQAKSEVMISLKSLFGSTQIALPEKDIQSLTPFFAKIRNDTDYFIQKLKIDFPRKRPFLYLPELKPCVAKEVSMAYPSGHTALARVFAAVLTDLYPSKKSLLNTRADRIGHHRVLSGMHHPSDVEAGKILGDLVWQELKSSESFQKDLSSARKTISSR